MLRAWAGGGMTRPLNILFLCTGNSARSILAEAILNREGAGRCHAFSAGSYPKGQVHPAALALLRARDLPTEGLRSKSWDEFEGEGAPPLDVVITVCDNAAGETCPIWPGRPVRAHWGIADPAAVEGPEQAAAFAAAYAALERRIHRFLALPLETLDAAALKAALAGIGAHSEAEAELG